MIKIIKNIFFITSFIFFIAFVIFFYLSEKNIILINKGRSLYLNENNIKLQDLPLLENDTENIIEYSSDVENYKKNKKKYIFWDLIK
tara:strand:+ start:52 stop:312 length:261 start_codon:yes stop_codon:yes gene_type:complete